MAPDIKATLARAAAIPQALADEARALLDKNPQAWSQSLLYATATQKKIKDTERRVSEFRAITDDNELWDACERIVAAVSAEDSNYTYALVRTDATHLRYSPGGFFKIHQDFLSLQTNCVDEYTLLLSLNTPDEAAATRGGATLVYRTAGGDGDRGAAEAYDTTAPGAAVLFRKDLDHEGERVEAGTKNLLSLNLLGFRTRKSSQVLLVDFAADDNEAEEPARKKGPAALLAAANDARSYAIPADEVTGMLEAHCRWANRLAEGRDAPLPSVIRFRADCSREAFDVVYRVLRRMHVSAEAVATHAATLDFFGPFDAASLLIDIDRQGLRDAPGFEGEIDMSDPRVICCESAARTEVVATLAKELGLPYVRFKVVFVEGCLGIAGDAGVGDPVRDVPLMPAWIALGDKGNLLFTESLANLRGHAATDLADMLAHCAPEAVIRRLGERTQARYNAGWTNPLDTAVPGEKLEPFQTDFDSWEIDDHLCCNGVCWGLRVALDPDSEGASSEIHASILHDSDRRPPLDNKLVFLPGAGGADDDDAESLFRLDASGATCFSGPEAARASEFLVSVNFVDAVKRSLQRKRFELPQQSAAVRAHFCNETVYGNLNVLSVTGVVRLDPHALDEDEDEAEGANDGGDGSDASSESEVTFGWPSAEAHEETERFAELVEEANGNYPEGFKF